MTDAGTKAVRVRISGRVQGVWFRGWTHQEAAQLGIEGWIRNRSDGSVEALFAGPPEAVDELVRRCRRGPPYAAVQAVSVEAETPPDLHGFHSRPTR